MERDRVAQTSGASLIVLENDKVRVYPLDTKPQWKVGRHSQKTSKQPDILFQSNLVSREHGWLRNMDGWWFFEDSPGNLNGTFHNGVKLPHSGDGAAASVPLKSGDVLRIDNEDLGQGSSKGVMMYFTTAPIEGTWTTYPLTEQTTHIGRSASCHIVEALPYISAHHAKISYENEAFYLTDCNSRAGTFLNGRRIQEKVMLREKDCITICDRRYFFLGDKLLYERRSRKKKRSDGRRPVILSADIKSKCVKVGAIAKHDLELLRDIRLDVREGTLVAVLGTAGAGKSTLLGCLSGLDRSGVTGTVVYRGVDLLKNLDQIKYLIGNVPQEKVIRPELTPEKTLWESAELRLSAQTTKEQIRQRVENTLQMLSMTGVRDTLNSRLSGGEKTRVNVGIDLVADRDIYFLDEPEQGLSPNLRDDLYVFLRDLAHKHGKTIIAIIHDVSCIDMFDQVIFLVKANGVGRLAFSGSPEEGSRHFGVPISKAYALLEAHPERYVR